MDAGEDADLEGLVHGVEVVVVEERLQALDRRGEAQRAEEDERGERAQDLDPGPAEGRLQLVAAALELETKKSFLQISEDYLVEVRRSNFDL